MVTMKCEGGLTGEEGILELEEYYDATTTMKIGPDKTHQWILHLGRNLDEDQDVRNILTCLPTHCL